MSSGKTQLLDDCMSVIASDYDEGSAKYQCVYTGLSKLTAQELSLLRSMLLPSIEKERWL